MFPNHKADEMESICTWDSSAGSSGENFLWSVAFHSTSYNLACLFCSPIIIENYSAEALYICGRKKRMPVPLIKRSVLYLIYSSTEAGVTLANYVINDQHI